MQLKCHFFFLSILILYTSVSWDSSPLPACPYPMKFSTASKKNAGFVREQEKINTNLVYKTKHVILHNQAMLFLP